MKHRRRLAWLTVSLALHACALWLLARVPATPATQGSGTIQLALVARPFAPLPIEPPRVSPPPVVLRPPSVKPRSKSAELRAMPSVDAKALDSGAAMPRTAGSPLALSAPSAGSVAAMLGPRLPRDAPAAEPSAKLHADIVRFSLLHDIASQRAKAGARGTLAELRSVLRDRFAPHPALGHADQSHAKTIARQLMNDYQATTGARSVDHLDGSEDSPTLRAFWQSMGPNRVGAICLGACDQKHEVQRLTVIVHVKHDTQGLPVSWQLALSSGHSAFDDEAMATMGQVARRRLKLYPGEPIPEWSEWAFQQITYRWGPFELALDPAFKPPGVVDDARSDALGKATVVAETDLIAVAYQQAASRP